MTLSVSAAAAESIGPASLELHTREEQGFAGPRQALRIAGSAHQWTEESEEFGSNEANEEKHLKANGFREGVMEYFRGSTREGVYDALLFGASGGASRELVQMASSDFKTFEKKGLARSNVPGIPGSVTLGNFQVGHRGATDNVFFATGRCFFVVADRFSNASNRTQASGPATAVARALFRRLERSCK